MRIQSPLLEFHYCGDEVVSAWIYLTEESLKDRSKGIEFYNCAKGFSKLPQKYKLNTIVVLVEEEEVIDEPIYSTPDSFIGDLVERQRIYPELYREKAVQEMIEIFNRCHKGLEKKST